VQTPSKKSLQQKKRRNHIGKGGGKGVDVLVSFFDVRTKFLRFYGCHVLSTVGFLREGDWFWGVGGGERMRSGVEVGGPRVLQGELYAIRYKLFRRMLGPWE